MLGKRMAVPLQILKKIIKLLLMRRQAREANKPEVRSVVLLALRLWRCTVWKQDLLSVQSSKSFITCLRELFLSIEAKASIHTWHALRHEHI